MDELSSEQSFSCFLCVSLLHHLYHHQKKKSIWEMLLKYAISGSFRSAATVSIRVSKRQPRARDPNDRHHPRHAYMDRKFRSMLDQIFTYTYYEWRCFSLYRRTRMHALVRNYMRCNAVERPHRITAFITGWLKREMLYGENKKVNPFMWMLRVVRQVQIVRFGKN